MEKGGRTRGSVLRILASEAANIFVRDNGNGCGDVGDGLRFGDLEMLRCC